MRFQRFWLKEMQMQLNKGLGRAFLSIRQLFRTKQTKKSYPNRSYLELIPSGIRHTGVRSNLGHNVKFHLHRHWNSHCLHKRWIQRIMDDQLIWFFTKCKATDQLVYFFNLTFLRSEWICWSHANVKLYNILKKT